MDVEQTTRTKILELAIAAIQESGEVGVRVNHIAAAAGVTPPTLYRHFGSREGLVIAAQAERYIRIVQGFAQADWSGLQSCQTAEEFKEKLLKLIRSYWLPAGRQRRMERINVLGAAYARPELRERIAQFQNDIFQKMGANYEKAQQLGWMRSDFDPPAMLSWIASLALGRVVVELDEDDPNEAAWQELTEAALSHLLFP